jgi:hypothetical protein
MTMHAVSTVAILHAPQLIVPATRAWREPDAHTRRQQTDRPLREAGGTGWRRCCSSFVARPALSIARNLPRPDNPAVAQLAGNQSFRRWSSVMGEIVRRVLDGYVTLIEWSPSDAASVEAAEAVFRREVEGGYTAVVEDDGVHASEPVRSLPIDAQRVVMTMPMGGG